MAHDPWKDTPRPNVLDPTHARPEPWFVGSGKGLMIAVLSICAVLIAVRGISTIWLVEAAWDRWTHRAVSAPIPAPPAPEPLPAFRPPPVDLPLPVGGRPAAAADDEASWIEPDDYPASSIRADQQGTSTIRWIIASNGRVSNCGTVLSSGHRLLDAAACSAIERRGRYVPARAADGRALATTKTRRVKWVLPS